MSPMSEARKRANKKWNDANMKERYDRVQLILPKGRKAELQAIAEKHGQSVNGFINSLIDAALNSELDSTSPVQSPGDAPTQVHGGQGAGGDTINQSGADSISGEERTCVRPIVAQSPIQGTHHELTDDDFPELSHEDLTFLRDFNR